MAHLAHLNPRCIMWTVLDGHPRARTMPEEIARVVRARGQPRLGHGMMRHGFAVVRDCRPDNLAAFAHLTRNAPAHLFDLYFDANTSREDLVAFLELENQC
jgi:cobaltochelatase CobN